MTHLCVPASLVDKASNSAYWSLDSTCIAYLLFLAYRGTGLVPNYKQL